ncbi:cysteine proteinase [Sodiomyces alkalinus F11]|uniref:Cysteine proteinase n=1 Tax=Sodiomyces alkalinus (strain CBS 110278 / VKM F-3762 / F11) TaxID=1314773 RepID=A0A3N2PJD8_SODAK|nr:cysteine proteinase [Sodiomyces alkalinus F11]ROT34642.1 cysteine proteinase [Sodiomyces alkalinus F11]
MEETLEQIQARHRKEQRDLVARITNKKKSATKKTRKGINDECAELERQLKARQADEVARATGPVTGKEEEEEEEEPQDEAVDEVLSERMQNTSIKESEDGAPTPPTSSPPPGGGGGGKKRNRQKERMARRAAEIEAAAAKAEEEAKDMTDHRGLERKYMAEVFVANDLVEKDIRPDGHCLFSAVADQLQQHGIPLRGGGGGTDGNDGNDEDPPYRIVRKAATGWMAGRPDDYAPFLEEPLDAYLAKIRDTAEWGGQLELAALAARYGVEIRVVQDGRTERIEPPPGGVEAEKTKTIWLAYYRHGFGLGEHYNSLRKKA